MEKIIIGIVYFIFYEATSWTCWYLCVYFPLRAGTDGQKRGLALLDQGQKSLGSVVKVLK